MIVLSRLALLGLFAGLVGTVAALEVVARRLGRPRHQRRAGATGVLGNGGLVLASVGSDGVFGVVVRPPLPWIVTTTILVGALVCLAVSLASLYRWQRDRARVESVG